MSQTKPETEIADPYLKGHRDFMDFVWTAAGMVVYVVWIEGVQRILQAT